MNHLDEIVSCDITISTPATEEASFSTILLVVPAPKTAGSEIKDILVISQAKDLKEYGFTDAEPAYKASEVAFSQNPAPNVIYIAARKEAESIKAVLDRAIETNEWYGIHLTSFCEKGDINDAKTWAEANAKLFGFEYADIDNFPVTGTDYYRTFGFYAKEGEYAALAWMAKCFGYPPGSETWALKSLATIMVSKLTSTEKKKLDDLNITYYLKYAGKNITCSTGGKVLAGEWIDIIRFRDWLKNAIQTRVFHLFVVNQKIPYDDSGITAIEGQVLAALAEGQELGGIAKTSYDADGNTILGYTVTVPLAAKIPDAQKAKRKLTGCKFTARLAGAIHMASISGDLAY